MKMTNRTRLENDKAELERLGSEMFTLQVKLDDNRNDSKTARDLSGIKTLYDVKNTHYQIFLKYVTKSDLLDADYLETYAKMLNARKG